MKKGFLIILMAFFGSSLFAHEDWIDVNNYYPAVGDTITIYLSGGHHYPESETLLAERLIYQPEIVTPAGRTESLKFTAEKNRWKTSYVIKKAGVYVAKFALKKPQMDSPLFYGKALIIAGNKDQTASYTANLPMEISPIISLSSIKPDETLKFHLQKNGEPKAGTVILMPSGGKNNYLSTTENQPAQFTGVQPGKYLVYTEQSGTNCSVTFAIQK